MSNITLTHDAGAVMSERLLLIDYENVQKIDQLAKVSGDIIVFVGQNQNKLPTDLVAKTQRLGSRLEWKQIAGNGRNALDFHIAYTVGSVLTKDPKRHCTVLSKDRGFDPLINGLRKDSHHCRRIEDLHDALDQSDDKAAQLTAPNRASRPVSAAPASKSAPIVT